MVCYFWDARLKSPLILSPPHPVPQGSDYLSKEKSRLEKMLLAGGVHASKVEDMSRKTSILGHLLVGHWGVTIYMFWSLDRMHVSYNDILE